MNPGLTFVCADDVFPSISMFPTARSFLGVATTSYDHFSRWVSKIRTATVGGLVKSPLICEPENETIQQLKFPISISQIAAIWGNIGITWNNHPLTNYFRVHRVPGF